MNIGYCTVFRGAERSGNQRLYIRETGEAANSPPLMIVKPRRRRDELKFSQVDRKRRRDGQDSDACLVSARSFGHNRRRRTV